MRKRRRLSAARANAPQAARAVLWSFLGIRKNRDYEADAVRLTPAQVIVAGLIGALLFIGALLLLVYLITRS